MNVNEIQNKIHNTSWQFKNLNKYMTNYRVLVNTSNNLTAISDKTYDKWTLFINVNDTYFKIYSSLDIDDIIKIDKDKVVYTEIHNTYYNDYENKYYIDAWKSNKTNEEGKVIAKIDLEGNIEILDKNVLCDKNALEAIKECLYKTNIYICNKDNYDYEK